MNLEISVAPCIVTPSVLCAASNLMERNASPARNVAAMPTDSGALNQRVSRLAFLAKTKTNIAKALMNVAMGGAI